MRLKRSYAKYYLATMGSGSVLNLTGKAGNLARGHDADVIVIDLNSRPVIEQRMRHADSLWEALFVQMILADDRAIRTTYIASASLRANCQNIWRALSPGGNLDVEPNLLQI
jgi:cytosine/adenosine deaminase-related metal-dependent hydrolase